MKPASKAERWEVFDAIDSERDYQDFLWNEETTTSKGWHSIEEWLLYMRNYIHRMETVLTEKPRQEADEIAIDLMRKVVAMGVASMEQHGAILREFEYPDA